MDITNTTMHNHQLYYKDNNGNEQGVLISAASLDIAKKITRDLRSTRPDFTVYTKP
tara:strand:- start:594 stop:761 length:168 start_codon:yes stop_codon:yes gene_type:complete